MKFTIKPTSEHDRFEVGYLAIVILAFLGGCLLIQPLVMLFVITIASVPLATVGGCLCIRWFDWQTEGLGYLAASLTGLGFQANANFWAWFGARRKKKREAQPTARGDGNPAPEGASSEASHA